jgi:hypothetical protein
MASGAIVPIAYAATTRDISLWETILRDIAHRAVKLAGDVGVGIDFAEDVEPPE